MSKIVLVFVLKRSQHIVTQSSDSWVSANFRCNTSILGDSILIARSSTVLTCNNAKLRFWIVHDFVLFSVWFGPTACPSRPVIIALDPLIRSWRRGDQLGHCLWSPRSGPDGRKGSHDFAPEKVLNLYMIRALISILGRTSSILFVKNRLWFFSISPMWFSTNYWVVEFIKKRFV